MRGSLRFLALLLFVHVSWSADLDLADPSLTYLGGSGAVALDPAATLTTRDFTGGSSFSIKMEFINSTGVPGEDLLQVRAGGSVTVAGGVVSVSGVVIGAYSPGTVGTPLNIVVAPGTTTVNALTVVRALAYHNIAGNGATQANRTIEVTVTDKNGGVSDSRVVAVGPGNAVPVLSIAGTLSVPRTARVVIGQSFLMATDTDVADTADKLTYVLGSLPQHGDLLFTPVDITVPPSPTSGDVRETIILGGVSTTFTQADVNAGRLRYQHRGGAPTSDGFTVRVRDPGDATTPLTAVSIAITGTLAHPVITLPVGALTITEQASGSQVMDAGAPVAPAVSVTDGDSLHYRRGELVVSLVDAVGADAGVTGDRISVSVAGDLTLSPNQSGYVYAVGTAIYVRRTDGTGNFSGPPASSELLGTRDTTQDGIDGRSLRIALASTVVEQITPGAWPPGSMLTGETEVVTRDAVANLIAALRFSHPGKNPPTTPRFIKVTVNEGDPNTGSGSTQRALTIVPVNDPPAFTRTGPLNLTAIVGRPIIIAPQAVDPDLPAGSALTYRLAAPVAGVTIDPASGAVTWIPGNTTPAVLDLIARDDQGADSAALHVTITPRSGPAADPPFIVSDPLVELAIGDLIFHPFTIVPPAGGGLPITAEIIGDAPTGAAVDFASPDKLSWTLTAPGIARPDSGIYSFGLRVTVTVSGNPVVGYQPITLVVIGTSGSN